MYKDTRQKIFVCSPLKGNAKDIFDIGKNVTKAREFCRRIKTETDFIPYAPHLLYPQFLNEFNPDDREWGISCGLAFLALCDQLWVFSKEGEESDGMKREIELARELNIPVVYKTEWLESV